jgi:hypothetical protein
MKSTILFIIISLSLLLTGCEQKAQQNEEAAPDLSSMSLPEEIDYYISQDQYETALARLDEEEVDQDILMLKEKVHLNYGIHIVYNADPSQMRENANNGLRQFIKVLDINRSNDKAISEIEQIMGIYSTFPDRAPDEDVVEELRRLGFNY